MPSNKAQILCRTTDETKKKLENIANKEKRSLSNLVELLIEQYIDSYEKENGNIVIQNNSNFGNINIRK